MENQTIKTGVNKVNLQGVVKLHNLKEGKGEKGKYINGNFVIKCGEFTEVMVKVMVSEKTKNKKDNKNFKVLKSLINKEYKTLADKVVEEEALKLSIWGNDPFTPQFKEEIYATDESIQEDESVTSLSIDLGFGNLTVKKDLKPDDYSATFDVNVYVQKVEQEIKNNVPTDRVLVRGYIPMYNGLITPITIIGGKLQDGDDVIDFGQQLLTQIMPCSTLNLFGDINYQSITKQVKKGGSLGKAKIETERVYVHELVAQGADFINNPEEMFSQEMVKVLMENRDKAKQDKIKEFKEKKKNGKKSKGLNMNDGISSNGGNVGIDSDDIPF